MRSFKMNGIDWFVTEVDSNSPLLIDRTGTQTIAVTDPAVHTVYIANNLTGEFRRKVLVHELCHCALVSYGLIQDIHKVVRPSDWIFAEEWICNLLADYGEIIFTSEELL